MANLVIKPASGSGNKIVFQNQAGLVDAITIEDSGNTTLAGTANNIGTVTGGTYKGTVHSDATFPAGHVLNTFEHVAANVSSTTDGEYVASQTLGTASGTSALSSSSNKLLITVSFILNTSSTVSTDHWRVFLVGDGLSQYTNWSTTGVMIVSNWHLV